MTFLLLDSDGGQLGSFRSVENLSGELEGPNGGFVAHFLDGSISVPQEALTQAELAVAATGLDGEIFFEKHLGVPMHLEVLGHDDGQILEVAIEVAHGLHLKSTTVALVRQWSTELPTTPNAWAPANLHERFSWLEAITLCPNNPVRQPTRSSSIPEFMLDTQYVDDYPSLFLATGEAINGPRGYYGRNLDALDDCCCGGYGLTPPFVLRIPRSEKLAVQLDRRAWERSLHYPFYSPASDAVDGAGESLLDAYCRVLRAHDVTVRLE